MVVHINFAFFVERKILKMSLDVVRSDVGVVMSPGKLIIFPPTVSCMLRVSDFCDNILATIIP